MKLLYIANARIPTEKAHGLHIVKMCQALAAHGADVTLILPQRKNSIQEDLFSYYGIKKIFKVHYLPIIDLAAKGWFGYWITQLLFSWRLLRFNFNPRLDIILTRDELSGWLMSKRRFKVFYDMHGFPETWRVLWKIAMRKMTGIICTNEWKMRQTEEFFKIPYSRMVLARNGFDPDEFNAPTSREIAREQLGLPLEQPIALYAGHLYDWKGVDTLAWAAAHLPRVLLVFVGGTAQNVEEFKKRHAHCKNILVFGQRPHEQIPLFLAAADILVLPNSRQSANPRQIPYSIYDTSPIKLFEYMASRRPIIASDLPSIREILDERTAVFFEPDNPESLAQKIGYVLSATDEPARMAEQAFHDAQNYTWEKRAKIILEFIKIFL